MRHQSGYKLGALAWAFAVLLAGRVEAQASVLQSHNSVHTLPAGRTELALFQLSRVGLTDHLELATQPFMPFFPQAELKAHWTTIDSLLLGTRLRLAYPTGLLGMLSGKGALALLPADTDVPPALLIEFDFLASRELAPDNVFTAALGVSVAPRASFRDVPVLDFPFLYARFAPLWTAATGRLQLAYDGRLAPWLGLSAGLRAYLLPVVANGFSVEPWAALRVLFGDHVALEAGLMAEFARYPAGLQQHELPYLDVLLTF